MKKVLSVVLAVFMLTAVLALSVAAEDHPSVDARDYFVIEINVDTNGGGNAIVNNNTVQKGKEIKFTANPEDGNEFDHWEIEGDYEIVEGDLNSPVIVIRPKGDIKTLAHFKNAGPKKDDEKTSPTTGYNMNAVVAVMAVVVTVSAAAVVVTGKKYYSAK